MTCLINYIELPVIPCLKSDPGFIVSKQYAIDEGKRLRNTTNRLDLSLTSNHVYRLSAIVRPIY